MDRRCSVADVVGSLYVGWSHKCIVVKWLDRSHCRFYTGWCCVCVCVACVSATLLDWGGKCNELGVAEQCVLG